MASGGASAVAAGQDHTCAIVNARAKCWGANQRFQLGLPDRAPHGVAKNQMGDLLPYVGPALPAQVWAIAAGGSHSCALSDGGTITCWGDNFYGQLGGPLATPEGSISPALSSFGAGAVSAGQAHTCLLSTDGRVSCWGDNRFGQLGAGSALPSITASETASPPVIVDLGVG
ncbi:MAG: hypothetical protein QOI66_2934, partial [Myxococcales bacterium]|nr:hypothetical protein [Myxococcales bacterium]